MSVAIARFKTMALDNTQLRVLEEILRRDRAAFGGNPRVKQEANGLATLLTQSPDHQDRVAASFLCGMAASKETAVADWAKRIIEILALVTPGSVRPLIAVGSARN